MIPEATYLCNLNHDTSNYIYTKYHYLHIHMYVAYIMMSVSTHVRNLYDNSIYTYM